MGKNTSENLGPNGWTRRGLTYEETFKKESAEIPANVVFNQLINLDNLAVKQGAGNFCVCALGNQAFAVGCAEPSEIEAQFMDLTVKKGAVFAKNTLFFYPDYPLMYFRLFIPSAPPESATRMHGQMVECLADFTEANFQEWVVTVRAAKNMNLNLRFPDGSHLAGGVIPLDQSFIDELIKAMDEADAALRKISNEKRDFQAASRSFFNDHPNPFLF